MGEEVHERQGTVKIKPRSGGIGSGAVFNLGTLNIARLALGFHVELEPRNQSAMMPEFVLLLLWMVSNLGCIQRTGCSPRLLQPI